MSAGALFELATKANNLAPVDCAPAPPEQKLFMPDYVNNATVSDVTFLVWPPIKLCTTCGALQSPVCLSRP